jgi:hypothetical protein
MLRPVQAAMEDVVELGTRQRLAILIEDDRAGAAGAPPSVGLGRDRAQHHGPAAVGEVPPAAEHEILRGDLQEHQIGRVPLERVESDIQPTEIHSQLSEQAIVV